MHGYSKWEWMFLKVGFFSMTGLAMPSSMVGLGGIAFENRTVVIAAAVGLTVAAAIGAATVIVLQITGRRGRDSRRR